jgi:glyoxylase-like metal-dependent hydrolase (beta-lactamase superfamily II)
LVVDQEATKSGCGMFFKQVKAKIGDNFSYIIADEHTKEAIVVDPSYNVEEIIKIIDSNRLSLKYVFNTHCHGDHTAGNSELKARYGSYVVSHSSSPIPKDLSVNDGDTIKLGEITVRVIHTPGHSSDSICLLVDGKILTGDTLFVGECGRTDLAGGDPRQMYRSLFEKIMTLSDDIEVYPGHDYGQLPKSTIGHERRTNYTLRKRSLDEFVEFMQTP